MATIGLSPRKASCILDGPDNMKSYYVSPAVVCSAHGCGNIMQLLWLGHIVPPTTFGGLHVLLAAAQWISGATGMPMGPALCLYWCAAGGVSAWVLR